MENNSIFIPFCAQTGINLLNRDSVAGVDLFEDLGVGGRVGAEVAVAGDEEVVGGGGLNDKQADYGQEEFHGRGLWVEN
jgi:hypothetical protein